MLISRHEWVAVDHVPIICRGDGTAMGWASIPENRCKGVFLSPEKRTQNGFHHDGRMGLYTEEVA